MPQVVLSLWLDLLMGAGHQYLHSFRESGLSDHSPIEVYFASPVSLGVNRQ